MEVGLAMDKVQFEALDGVYGTPCSQKQLHVDGKDTAGDVSDGFKYGSVQEFALALHKLADKHCGKSILHPTFTCNSVLEAWCAYNGHAEVCMYKDEDTFRPRAMLHVVVVIGELLYEVDAYYKRHAQY